MTRHAGGVEGLVTLWRIGGDRLIVTAALLAALGLAAHLGAA